MKPMELLFNPFRRYAGFASLMAGLLIILLTALVAVAAVVHLDGVIDLHAGTKISFAQAIGEGLINFLCMAIILFLVSLIVSKTKPRFIDVAGTQALARAPFLLATLVNMFPNHEQVMKYVEHKYLHHGDE